MLVLLLMILWPVAEVFVAIKVADAIGALLTVLLLLASWPIGIWLLRSEGRAAWRRFRQAVAARRPPGGEAIDGVLVVLGGFLLIVPGFITDVLGLPLLLATTRRPLRRLITGRFGGRVVNRAARWGSRRSDVDSTARDIDQPQLHG